MMSKFPRRADLKERTVSKEETGERPANAPQVLQEARLSAEKTQDTTLTLEGNACGERMRQLERTRRR
jgi:hypothetical protein